MPPSAARIAGSNSVLQGLLPKRCCTAPSITIAPGTPVERPPKTPSRQGMAFPSGCRNMSAVAPAGAVSRPSKAVTLPVAAS